MREIPLTRGMVALVDDEDYERLSLIKWCAHQVSGGKIYASTKGHVYMHRMILNAPKGMVVDHIDGDGLNNQRANIRLCHPHQNIAHRTKPHVHNTSGYIGVSWHKRSRKWMSHICHRGNSKTIGYYHDVIEAAIERDKWAKELHGEFAYLNFPEATP